MKLGEMKTAGMTVRDSGMLARDVYSKIRFHFSVDVCVLLNIKKYFVRHCTTSS